MPSYRSKTTFQIVIFNFVRRIFSPVINVPKTETRRKSTRKRRTGVLFRFARFVLVCEAILKTNSGLWQFTLINGYHSLRIWAKRFNNKYFTSVNLLRRAGGLRNNVPKHVKKKKKKNVNRVFFSSYFVNLINWNRPNCIQVAVS